MSTAPTTPTTEADAPGTHGHGYCGRCHDFTGAPLPEFWVLNEQNEPMPATIYEWGMWRQATENHVVALTEFHVAGSAGPVLVSTVFPGIDHGFGLGERPVLFETMVFGGALDELQHRYCTWDEAVAGHKAIVVELMARYVAATEGD